MKPTRHSLAVALACLVPAPALAVSLELGAGGLVPFDSAQRRVFGLHASATLGAYVPLGTAGARGFLEVGYVQGSGSDAFDPTFEVPDRKYSVIPVTLGVDGDLVKPSSSRFRFRAGIGWTTAIVAYEDESNPRETVPAFGLMVEFRPVVRFEGWDLWVRQRFTVGTNALFESTNQELNMSGSQLQVGVGWHL